MERHIESSDPYTSMSKLRYSSTGATTHARKRRKLILTAKRRPDVFSNTYVSTLTEGPTVPVEHTIISEPSASDSHKIEKFRASRRQRKDILAAKHRPHMLSVNSAPGQPQYCEFLIMLYITLESL